MSAAVLLAGSLQGLGRAVEEMMDELRPKHDHMALVGDLQSAHIESLRAMITADIERAAFGCVVAEKPQPPLTLESLVKTMDELRPKIDNVLGMPIKIVHSKFLPLIQFRFPRSKKKRIRAKWAKRPENFRRVQAFMMTTERNVTAIVTSDPPVDPYPPAP